MAESTFDKTEPATPRKRQEARKQGNVARSPDLTAACMLLASIILLYIFGLKIITSMRVLMQAMLSDSFTANSTGLEGTTELFVFAGKVAIEAVAPLALGITAVTLLITVFQVGLLFTLKPLTPSLSKISPLQGVVKLVDVRAGMRLVMSLGKIAIIAAVAVVTIYLDMPRILSLAELEPIQILGSASQIVFLLALKLAILLLMLAILDYAFQKWQHARDMRMSKQEVKEEMKQMDGDPLVKQRRLRVARQIAMQRIGQSVPTADVIVTNPTHFSVALRYDSAKMTAPKVVAKGADFLAMRIRQIGIANNVPLVERKEIARALYQTVEVGQEVPPQFYAAVAEILAYVYRLSGRKSA